MNVNVLVGFIAKNVGHIESQRLKWYEQSLFLSLLDER